MPAADGGGSPSLTAWENGVCETGSAVEPGVWTCKRRWGEGVPPPPGRVLLITRGGGSACPAAPAHRDAAGITYSGVIVIGGCPSDGSETPEASSKIVSQNLFNKFTQDFFDFRNPFSIVDIWLKICQQINCIFRIIRCINSKKFKK